MSTSLDKLTIKGFKSIKDLNKFELKNLNVIVGANGAGKSNLISFFRLLQALIDGNLNRYVRDSGGAGDLLFNGRKTTKKMHFTTHFDNRGFRFNLVPTPSDKCAIEDEARYYAYNNRWWELGDSEEGKSKLVKEVLEDKSDAQYSKPVYDAISSWQIYHFHDTSSTASMRHYEIIQDNKVLREDASNIGPFLLKLKDEYPADYKAILNAIRLVTPFFDDFILEPQKSGDKEQVNISWYQKGSDYPMQPYHLSDGSIRFICLATALLQPNPPSTIIIDEPELGLHPAAIVILGELIQQAAQRTQVIVATQSPALIDQFAIEDIVVVNRKDGASTFERLNEKDFSEWLESYSVGELWTKNVIAGGPRYE
ncbi:SMC domain-containing protein [Oleiphilus messinensis]|uniref:SMC domain-containing protein n=1 Tax=Oleiphilus messinensis TaxID=141451 RepID=A0A1Y0IEH9_9GAMM|nr:AAA family ATPase [Oleiphilus messinensis]ARU58206.1 SMC domain-containing protein [Oleiphilus messinensis]